MLYYNSIDISEEIDLAKSNDSKECIIYHYVFFNHRFGFQDFIYNGCHDFMFLSCHVHVSE